MCDFSQGVRLVHKLRELAAAKKLLDGRDNRLSIDQVMRQHRFHVEKIHALFDASLHPHQAQSELIFQEFTDGSHPAIP